MAYSTTSDVVARLPDRTVIDLTDDEKLATSSTSVTAAAVLNASITTRITAAIVDADIVIDAHVRQRYDVPVDPAPALLTKLSVDLTMFNLHTRRGSVFEMPEWVMAKRTDALAMLKRISKAEIDIGVEPPPAVSSKVVADVSDSDRLFTQDTLESF